MSKKILVVDDEMVMVNLLTDLFEENGYEVITALSGPDGIIRAKDENPDLIILDINMPGMVGCAMSEVLKEIERTKHIPIIFLTGFLDEEDADELKHELAGHSLLTKPFNNDELLAKVKDTIGK